MRLPWPEIIIIISETDSTVPHTKWHYLLIPLLFYELQLISDYRWFWLPGIQYWYTILHQTIQIRPDLGYLMHQLIQIGTVCISWSNPTKTRSIISKWHLDWAWEVTLTSDQINNVRIRFHDPYNLYYSWFVLLVVFNYNEPLKRVAAILDFANMAARGSFVLEPITKFTKNIIFLLDIECSIDQYCYTYMYIQNKLLHVYIPIMRFLFCSVY